MMMMMMMMMMRIILVPGVMRWVQTLTWPGLDNYNSAYRQPLLNPDTELTEAFVKAHDRLKFYWILGAGHSVGGLSICRTRSAGRAVS